MSFKEELLYILDDLGEGTWLMITHRLSLRRLHYPRASFYPTVDRLVRQGLIKKHKKDRIVYVSLTTRGRALLKHPISKRHREDRLSTLIIFDIPEKHRKAREALRRYLMRSGYTNLQESVMISPFVAGAELKELLEELKLRPYVSVILGKIDHYFR